jgi:hypothetical protein
MIESGMLIEERFILSKLDTVSLAEANTTQMRLFHGDILLSILIPN